jgi:2-polyprenyl-6-methoxyphenol hydroxylase-like FAD-dependent oxidoreductase
MIPPVTGNGMSMAFESAELAIAPLAAHSRGAISWSAACRQIAGDCDRRFATRLAWGRWLQRLMFWPPARGWTGRLALGSNLIWETVFARTR